MRLATINSPESGILGTCSAPPLGRVISTALMIHCPHASVTSTNAVNAMPGASVGPQHRRCFEHSENRGRKRSLASGAAGTTFAVAERPTQAFERLVVAPLRLELSRL